jgi:hypothetical protein
LFAAAETGVAATIGTAIVGSAVSTGVATAVGTAVIAGGVSAAQGNDAGQVLQDALLGGVTSVIGGEIASGVNQTLLDAGVAPAAAAITSSATSGALTSAMKGGDPLLGALSSALNTGASQAVDALVGQAALDNLNTTSANQLAADNAQLIPPSTEDVLSAMGSTASDVPATSLPDVPQVAENSNPPQASDVPAGGLPASFDMATAFPENMDVSAPSTSDVIPPAVVDSSPLPAATNQVMPQDQLGDSTSMQAQAEMPGALPTDATDMFGEPPTDQTAVAGALPAVPAEPAPEVTNIADLGGGLPVEALPQEPYLTAGTGTDTTTLAGTEPVNEPYATAGAGPGTTDTTTATAPTETTAQDTTTPKLPGIRFNLGAATQALGALGGRGTTGGGLQGTQQAAGDSGIPWLNTSPQMLAGQAPTRSPDIIPELLAALQERGIGAAHGGSIHGYAAGGDLVNTCLNDALKTLTAAPKFYPVKCNMLTMPAVKRSPLALSGLRQLQPHISGGMGGMARGGLPAKYREAAPDGHNPEFITGLTGYYAGGRGTGQSDDIPAMLHDGDYVIDAEAVSALGDGSSKAGNEVLMNFMKQVPHRMAVGGNPVPAKIADGEVVLPESFVTALGGGDNKRGARMLDQMRQHLREHKRSAPNSRIPPKAKTPMEYLRGVKG